MNITLPFPSSASYTWLAPLASTLGILFFLFFIDEGYYDLRWMADAGNWIVFFIYFIIMIPIQLGISELVFRHAIGRKKLLLMMCVSMPTTIMLMLGFFFLLGEI
jgi:hypothetical protein